jgi:hypothetical protein
MRRWQQAKHIKAFSARRDKKVELKLIESKKEKPKTEFKIPLNEFNNSSWLKPWLSLAGADLEKPDKQNSRNIYFTVEGDYLNGKFN